MHWLCIVGYTAMLAASDAPDVKVVEEIVAKVDAYVITRSELDKARAADADALRNKIDELLLVSRARELDIKVDAEITRLVARIQASTHIADPDQFHQWMYQQTGLTFEDWKQQQTDFELRRRVLSQEVGAHINVPKEELQDYYNRHKSDFVREGAKVFLREILVATGDEESAGHRGSGEEGRRSRGPRHARARSLPSWPAAIPTPPPPAMMENWARSRRAS